jgi:hypothetical protein
MGTLRFFEEVVSFKIRRTFGFADYTFSPPAKGDGDRTGDARQEHGQRASSRSEPQPRTAVQEGRAPTAARRKGAGRNPGRNLVKWK